MKLNLQILREELAPVSFEAHIIYAVTDFPCVLPRLYRAGMPFEGAYAYVARAADLPEHPSVEGGSPSIISIGYPPEAYMRAPFSTLLTDDDVDAMDVFDRAVEVFERYDEWGCAMQKVVDDNGPLKAIGQLAEPYLNNPIYVQGSSFKCLFHITGPLDTLSPEQRKGYLGAYGGGPVPLSDNSYLPLEGINELISDPEYLEAIEADGPTIYNGDMYIFRDLFCNIGEHGHYVARVCVDELYHAFTERDFANVAILALYLAKGLHGEDVDSYNRPRDLDAVLESLLSHHLIDEQRIVSVLTEYHWSVSDRYFCMVMESKSEDHSWMTLKALAIQLMADLPSECYVVFDNQLVFIFNLTQIQLTRDDVLERSIPRFRDNLLSAGISETFNDFKNLYYYYTQAISALTIGKKLNPMFWYFQYEDYNLDNMVRRCKGTQIAETFYPRGLRLLMEHDEQKDANLVGLLRIYLDCNMSITETTRAAFMHRNTCMYRVNRIEEISHLELSDPKVRLELNLAFAIMDLR